MVRDIKIAGGGNLHANPAAGLWICGEILLGGLI